jgi:hypothetical protein
MGSATETREGNRVPLANKEVGLAQPKPSGTDHSDSISCINLMYQSHVCCPASLVWIASTAEGRRRLSDFDRNFSFKEAG